MKKIILFSWVLALGSCQTVPVHLDGIKEGRWTAKVLVKDREQGRSYIVNLNVNAIRGERVRVDITSTLGLGVASLVADRSEVRYLLLDSKRMYFGVPQPDVMRPILSIPLDPRWLQNLFFEDAFEEKSWSCTRAGGWLKECSDSVTHLNVKWTNRSGEKRTILIDHPKASLQINVLSFKPKVEDRKNLFVLEAPPGFKRFKVR